MAKSSAHTTMSCWRCTHAFGRPVLDVAGGTGPTYRATGSDVNRRLRVRAIDPAGNNTLTDTLTFDIDAQAPITRALPPGGRYYGPLEVEIVAVDSAGTGPWHVGHPPDRRMCETASRFASTKSFTCATSVGMMVAPLEGLARLAGGVTRRIGVQD